MWTPDVYEGAPTAVMAFMATATKTIALATLLRVMITAFAPASDVWESAVAAVAIASMLIGNIAALRQTNVKRMLAYSSVGQAGYLLIAVVVHTPLATRALLYYLAVYAAMNLGALAVVSVREREIGGPVFLDDLRGLGRDHPLLAGGLALSLLSLASFPPTGGFLAKLYLFGSAIDAGKSYLAVIGVIGTMISLAYYLRFLMAIYTRPGSEAAPAHRAGDAPRGHRGARLGRHRALARRRAGSRSSTSRAPPPRRSCRTRRPSDRPKLRRLRPCLESHGSVTAPFSSTRPQARASSSTRGITGNPSWPEGLEVERCDAILLTHGHGDHAGDVAALAKQYSAPVATLPELAGWLESAGRRDGTVGFGKGGAIEIAGLHVTHDERRALLERTRRHAARRSGRLRDRGARHADDLRHRRHRRARRHGPDRRDLRARDRDPADRRPLHDGPAPGRLRGAPDRRRPRSSPGTTGRSAC